jgi:opacity protein-like surface antigen
MINLLKNQVFLLMFCAAAGSIYALDLSLSTGGGVLLGYTFTRYTLEGDTSEGKVKSVQSMDRFDFGGFVFADTPYAEASVSLQSGSGPYRETMRDIDLQGMQYETALGLSLMGKYPFALNERWSLFPMAGVEYLIAFVERRQPDGGRVVDRTGGTLPSDTDKDGNAYPLSAWNALLIKIGAGADCTLNRFIFLRGELLYGFRLQTEYETGALEMAKDMLKISSPQYYGLTSGPNLKIAVGYRFL